MTDARNERRAGRAKAGTDLLISLAVVAAATAAALFLAQPAKASERTVYLVTVVVVLPGPNAPRQELAREWITASSASVCIAHAAKLAAQQLEQHADTVKRLGATVRGLCHLQGEQT